MLGKANKEGALEFIESVRRGKTAWDSPGEIEKWGCRMLDSHRDQKEYINAIAEGLSGMNMHVPASVSNARALFDRHLSPVITTNKASAAPPLTRRARLILIGGAVVAVAAYVYHRRRAARHAAELEAVRTTTMLEVATAMHDAAAAPQRPSRRERSEVEQKLEAETARDAAVDGAARARADNDRLRAENARVAKLAGDEVYAARAESIRLKTEVNRLRAEVARVSVSADTAAVDALRRDNVSLRAEIAGLEAHLQDSNSQQDELKGAVQSLRRENADINCEKLAAVAKARNREACLEQAEVRLNALRPERDHLLAENTSLLTERASLVAERASLYSLVEESAQLVPAPSAGDLAALSDTSLAAFSAEAAVLAHSLVREDSRRAALAATSTAATNECVICSERPLQVAFGCGHFCACEVCATGLTKCPICRAPVTERRRIYAS